MKPSLNTEALSTIIYTSVVSLWQHLHHAPHRNLNVWQVVNASLWDSSVMEKTTASMAQMNKEPVVC